MAKLQNPTAKHWFGTDNSGRDILSRLILGSRTVFIVAPISVICSYIVGCGLGLLAGYFRGWVDFLVSRIADILLSFPAAYHEPYKARAPMTMSVRTEHALARSQVRLTADLIVLVTLKRARSF